MRLSSNDSQGNRFAQATLFVLALTLTIFGIAGLAGQAKAGPVSLTFDNGRLGVGVLLDDEPILPADATFPSPDLQTSQRTDIQLNGNETNGNLSFPASSNTGRQFPYMHVISPTDPTLKVPLTFRLRDPGLTGTYDAASGQTELSGNMDVIVIVGTGKNFPLPDTLVDTAVPPLGLFARYRVSNIPVSFSTETKSPFTAERFTAGFGKNGSLTTSWNDIPEAEIENGGPEEAALCKDQLDNIIHGPGGIWLANGGVAPKPQAIVPETCADDLRLCPLPTFVEISKVKVKPKKRSVKPGKKIKIKVKVVNSGTKDSSATKIKLRSSNRRVRVRKKPIRVGIPAGSSVTRKVTVKVFKKAKVRARITAAANGIRGGVNLKIKSKKNSRKNAKKRQKQKR